MREPQTITITPLTPLHIGCNADFEPNHYFIEEGWLYYFDPLLNHALLSNQEQEELQRLITQTRFTPEQSCALQRFFYEHRAHFKAATHTVVPVARSVETLYLQRVGVHTPKPREHQDRPMTPHRLIIERHAFDAHNLEPIIPGSLIKVPLRMAALSSLHTKRSRHSSGPSRSQREQFIDPIRHLHIHQMSGTHIARKILLCTNSLNTSAPKPASKPAAPTTSHLPPFQMTRREIILGGQYRALHGEFTASPTEESLADQEPAPSASVKTPTLNSFSDLAKVANAYFRPKFNIELHQLEQQGYANNPWFQNLRQLFNDPLRQAMDEGHAMLLRIGHHNAKGQLLPDAAWFAYHDDKTTLFPLGWIIVESAKADPIPELAAWCRQQPKPNPAPIWAAVERERKIVEEKRIVFEHLQQQAKERAAAQAAAEQARQATLNALSPEQRKVEELVQLLESSPVQGNTGTALFQQLWTVLQEALTWPAEEQHSCESRLNPLIKAKFPHLGKREKEVKACLRQLRGEDGGSNFSHSCSNGSQAESNHP